MLSQIHSGRARKITLEVNFNVIDSKCTQSFLVFGVVVILFFSATNFFLIVSRLF